MKSILKLVFFLNILFCAFFPKLVSAQAEPVVCAYPIGFKTSTNICFSISKADTVTLAVYDRWGRVVDSILTNQWKDSGTYSYTFNADSLPDAVYFVILQTKQFKNRITSIVKRDSVSELELSVYPNPFLDSTTIQFRLPDRGKVSIEAYNMLGQKVAQILQDSLIEADTTVKLYFNAVALPAGVYLINFKINCYTIKKTAIKINKPSEIQEPLKNTFDFKFFPNPFKNEITVSGLTNINGRLEIINNLGQVVKTQQLQNKEEINLQLTEIPAGAYFLKVTYQDGREPIIKLMIKDKF